MSHNFEISELGFRLIKAYEGYRPEPAVLVTGQTVIGYGHIVTDDSLPFIGKTKAEGLLREDLKPVEDMVNSAIHAPMTQSQFDALCSLAFNIGEDAFRGSHVRHAINNGRILDAAGAFDEWRKADIDGKTYVVDALMRRRTAEKALFLKAHSSRVTAGRDEIVTQSDDSFEPVSDDADMFDPEVGIVDQAPYAKKPAQFRRREDGPSGALTLSEVQAIDDVDASAAQLRGIDAPSNGLEMDDASPFIDDSDIAALAQDDFVLDDALLDDLEQPDFNTFADQDRPKKSPIALAAEEVGDRLDRLIEDTRDAARDAETDAHDDTLTLDKEMETQLQPAANGADRYVSLSPGADVTPGRDRENSGVYSAFMVAGGCLLGGGLMAQKLGGIAGSGWLAFAVPLAIVFGATVLLGSAYYLARSYRRNAV